ncbi:MAG: TetR/AcrR family transcriptional regulator [Clostridiales bacterium]|jgi:AcrR family transcriptional regulator|nr:TetR/AcrR family transcriptional regulator [Clostridiales bacterium]
MYKKKINASALRSRRRIAESLVELMKAKPFNDVTITDICENAQLVRKTFYRNFRSKDEVILYLLENVFKEFITERNINDMAVNEILLDVYNFIDMYRDFLMLFYQNNLLRFVDKNVAEFIVKERLYNEIDLSAIDGKCLRYIPAHIAALIMSIVETWIDGGFAETPAELAALTDTILKGKLYR